MEFIVLAIVLVACYVVYTGFKFANFKSQLMNEFGRRGVKFHEADAIFTSERDDINNLHHAGMPIDQIVDRYAVKQPFDEGQQTRSSAGKKLVEKPTEDELLDAKAESVVDFAIKILSLQTALFLNEDGGMPARALDEWSLGYVAGVGDVMLQANGFEADVTGMTIMNRIFIAAFGLQSGAVLFGEFMRLQSQENEALAKGMKSGGQDIVEWMSNSEKRPFGWMRHVSQI